MRTRRFSFDTSAFMPFRTPAGQWQRFTLEMTEEEEERVFARRMELDEEANRTGRHAKARAYDRWIAKRYSV